MSKIAVVTDSIACLPPEMVKQYRIQVAPCYLVWDKVQYRDGVDMSAEEAYSRLRTASTVPTTTSAIQGEFFKIFEELKNRVDGIITITVTGALGACYNSALAAKEMVPEVKIEVIDSRNCYMAQGFAVLAASKTVQAGGGLEAAVQAARDVISRAQTIFYIDTLEYIEKCGRVNLPREVLDKWLEKKVMMVVKDGKLVPQAISDHPADDLLQTMTGMTTAGDRLHVGIARGDIDSTELQNKVKALFSPCEVINCRLTPVAGVHTGPGFMGLSFYAE